MLDVRCVNWKNLSGVRLENEYLRIVILPCLGGKLASVYCKKKDFEIAAQNNQKEYGIPYIDADFYDYDAAGMDDMFPNIVGSQIRYRNQELKYPDHGEIWSSHFAYHIEGDTVHLNYESERFHYRYKKTISLHGNKVKIDYDIENQSEEPLPCIWAFHGLVQYEEDLELLFAEDVNTFENVLLSSELGDVGRRVSQSDGGYHFSGVPHKESGTMVKYYADHKLEKGFCGYRYPTQEVECLLEYDAQILPYLGVWITAGGYRGDYNCALEPANGYYDDIRIAGKNDALYVLEKEKPLVFSMNITVKEL